MHRSSPCCACLLTVRESLERVPAPLPLDLMRRGRELPDPTESGLLMGRQAVRASNSGAAMTHACSGWGGASSCEADAQSRSCNSERDVRLKLRRCGCSRRCGKIVCSGQGSFSRRRADEPLCVEARQWEALRPHADMLELPVTSPSSRAFSAALPAQRLRASS